MFDHLGHDLRQAWRRLKSQPGFTVPAVIVLALGIGATTAMFGIVDGVLIEPLPFEEPEALVVPSLYGLKDFREFRVDVERPYVDAWRELPAFEAIAGHRTFAASVLGSSGAEARGARAGALERQGALEMQGARVDPELFQVLGVGPQQGRTFALADASVEGAGDDGDSVVLGHRAWARLFPGSPDVLGQSVFIDGEPRTVIGVMGTDFLFPDDATDFWVPMTSEVWAVHAVARLAPGTSLAAAIEQVAICMERLAVEGKASEVRRSTVLPLLSERTEKVALALRTLWAAIACVLLLVSMNLAHLLLVRTLGKRHETAVRRALGASRWRVVRPVLVESLLLAVMGSVGGVLLSGIFLRGILVVLPMDLPRASNIQIDATALLLAVGTTLVCALLCGSLPVRSLLGSSAGEVSRGARTLVAENRLQGRLAVAEIALAVILTCGAGLLLRSWSELRQVDTGFVAENLHSFQVRLPYATTPEGTGELVAFREALVERLERIPGVEGVARTSYLPILGRTGLATSFRVEGREDQALVLYRVVSPSYLPMMQARLLRGRFLGELDGPDQGSPSVVVNESLADRFWPGWRRTEGSAVAGSAVAGSAVAGSAVAGSAGPLGARIDLGPAAEPFVDSGAVVGIVADMADIGLAVEKRPVIYIHQDSMAWWGLFDYVVSTPLPEEVIQPQLHRALEDVDPQVAAMAMGSLEGRIEGSIALERAAVRLVGAFAVIALLLAAFGIYGVVGYLVGQRQREIALRMALGATRERIALRILGSSLARTALGLGLGALGALALGRWMESLLYGVSGLDGRTASIVVAAILLASTLATLVPMVRAARIEPAVGLRRE